MATITGRVCDHTNTAEAERGEPASIMGVEERITETAALLRLLLISAAAGAKVSGSKHATHPRTEQDSSDLFIQHAQEGQMNRCRLVR